MEGVHKHFLISSYYLKSKLRHWRCISGMSMHLVTLFKYFTQTVTASFKNKTPSVFSGDQEGEKKDDEESPIDGVKTLKPCKVMMMENNYKMYPDIKFPFNKIICADFLRIQEKLRNVTYEEDLCKSLCLEVSDEILTTAKCLEIPRYKYLIEVFIGEKKHQSIIISSKCLWDSKNDNWTSTGLENSSLFAVAIVHAVYLE
uniref:Uncharacterized protein n=1 Tax=Eptatretus burgeri TaxID=7764 RepID=A0A8C4NJH3_EPTBU